MTCILIRHGNDSGDSYYKHDNSLNLSASGTEDDIRKTTKKLIKKYGYPKRIYCSPFYRAIQTVNIMKKIINKPVQVYVDLKLARYFSSKEKNNPNVKDYVRYKTLKYNPPIFENKEQFHKRVDKVNKKILETNVTSWYITHYLVMKRIAKHNDIKIPSYMPFLYTITL